jgi:23S rRNA (cytosine1962-C5)-methyltransferase
MRNTAAMRVRLRKPLERVIKSGHPWIYRDALVSYQAPFGRVVDVLDRSGRFLCRGLSESGPIGVRVFTTVEEQLDSALFVKRINKAFGLRKRIIPEATTAYRLLHGEGDGLPGITCDRYQRWAVLKLDGEAIEPWKDQLLQWIRQPLAEVGIDSLLVREKHRENKTVTLAWGAAPPEPLVVEERGVRLAVSLREGQKTGLFLDHRESRHLVRQISGELRVLNLYGYTGAFSVYAGLGGASEVTTVDVAAPAIELARQTWALNGLEPVRHHAIAADVPEYLTDISSKNDRFGLVIADPPSFAPREAARTQALRSYFALHKGALQITEPDGFYLSASCSSHIDRTAFEQTLQDGARAARRDLQVLGRWEAPPDHPQLLAFPEGNYLKITLTRVK